jgi:hypothetical protein
MPTWNPSDYGSPNNPYQYGRAGGLTWNSSRPSASLTDGSSGDGYIEGDPRYHRRRAFQGDASGSSWEPTEAWNRAHIRNGEGFSQVRDVSRLLDQNAVEWDDEFGWMTNNKNIKDNEDWLDKYGIWALAAPAAFGTVGALGGLEGLGMGAEMFGGAGAGVETGAGMFGGMDLVGAGPGWLAEGGSLSQYLTSMGLPSGLKGLSQLGSSGLKLVQSLLSGGGGAPGGSRGGGGGGGGNALNDLLRLALSGGAAYVNNKQNKNYESDINRMIDLGSPVKTSDRQGAIDTMRGIYDGSISGDQVFDRVPGLRAISERGNADIARRWSAKGESAQNDPHAMREWVNYNNELTTKAWDQEMNRMGRHAGFDFNPAATAGMGMDAFTKLDRNQRIGNNDIFRELQSLLDGSGDGDIFDQLAGVFGGRNSRSRGRNGESLFDDDQFFEEVDEFGNPIFDDMPRGSVSVRNTGNYDADQWAGNDDTDIWGGDYDSGWDWWNWDL